jgi:hypothetical protein
VVRLSSLDERRLSLLFASSAVPPLELRAESAACRTAWVEAFTAAAAAPPAAPADEAPAAVDEEADERLAAALACARAAMADALAGACSASAHAAALSALDEFASAAAARAAAGARRRRRLRQQLRAVRAERDALERELLRTTGVSGEAGGFSFGGATPEPQHLNAAAMRTPLPTLARWRSVASSPLAPRTLRRSLSDMAAPSRPHGPHTPPPLSYDDAAFQEHDHDDDATSSSSPFSAPERHTIGLAGYSSSSDSDYGGETWFDAAGVENGASMTSLAAMAVAAPLAWCPRRTSLPDAAHAAPPASLWALLRSAIGKDLTRLCLPVAFNEPLSALQAMAEEFEHSALLDHAAACPRGSPERHAAVAAFAVAGYARTFGRSRKPFNPLEGETYELRAPERRLRLLAEKARHHPPVLTWHCQGGIDDDDADASVPALWEAYGTVGLQPRFGGRRLELRPSGGCAVAIRDAGCASPEVFAWNRVSSFVGNLVLGPLAVSHAGDMRVVSDSTGAAWTLCFNDMLPDAPGAAKGPPAVHGALLRGEASMQGAWWGAPGLSVQLHPGGPCVALWPGGGAVAPGRAGAEYRWSSFAAGLNDLSEAQAAPGALPPTDSRLRPDQRLLEQGRYAEADAAKQRLEHKQRAARKRAAEAGGPPPPRWFRAAQPPRHAPDAAAGAWYEYSGGYWEASRARDWPGARRIFDDDVT